MLESEWLSGAAKGLDFVDKDGDAMVFGDLHERSEEFASWDVVAAFALDDFEFHESVALWVASDEVFERVDCALG